MHVVDSPIWSSDSMRIPIVTDEEYKHIACICIMFRRFKHLNEYNSLNLLRTLLDTI